MRLLLTGRNGQVGSELAQALSPLGEVIATDRSTLDIADADSIRRALREAKPQVIVNAAAYTAVDKAEAERELATRANADAPLVLGEEAKRLGALLVHFSTDYVFDGTRRSPYAEADAPNPLSHYARTKLDGERAAAASGCRCLVLRTSWVYGPRAANFYRVIRRKAAANEPMRMVEDQTSVPTPSVFLARQAAELVRRGAEGLLHLVPGGAASRYDFAREVVRACGSSSQVAPARTDEFPSAAQRPAYSVMSNARASAALGAALGDWRDALRECMAAWDRIK
jgi:dTDP-4-dehydrorhamnose reductase